MNDHEFLRSYFSNFSTVSDTAFTQLVELHLPLLFSAALRQVRGSRFAQDIAQQVFTLLVRKARRLAQNVVPSGAAVPNTSRG